MNRVHFSSDISFLTLDLSGLAADTIEGFRDELDQYWFAGYGRDADGPVDSSGFEHVMVGELDGSSVSGFHNWIEFYVQERDGDLQFEDLTRDCEVQIFLQSFRDSTISQLFLQKKTLSTYIFPARLHQSIF